MAKRKRLSAFGMLTGPEDEAAEAGRVPPVARIAADASAQAALNDLADELRDARDSGRMIVEIPLSLIDIDHLHRDRMHMDGDDMSALKSSIADRGQQTPIELVALADGRYGLISGARRLAALTALRDENGDSDRFGKVRALLRPFDSAPEAYLAMVEENEIRADLSFYERGRLAHEAARIGVFDSPAAAVKALFVHAPPAKRSKILSFVALHDAVGPALKFPEAIPEKLGLALVKAIQQNKDLRSRLIQTLQASNPLDVSEERAVLEAVLHPAATVTPKPNLNEADIMISSGVRLKGRPGKVVLTGRLVTDELLKDLAEWLKARS